MKKVQATPLLKSMASRAAHVTPGSRFGTLITEHIDGACVQCAGSATTRNTLDGRQPSVRVSWFINCKKSSRAKVYERFGEPVPAATQHPV